MRERILSILNLKVAESKYVFDLLSIQLFIGIANSFINIAAFTFFIYAFSVNGIPYAYIASAVGLLILNVVYEKLEQKFSPLHLLKVLIGCSIAILLLLWTGLLVSNKTTFIFLLFVWSTLFYMMTGYGYWGLVSLLFNIRESKRVFSIVGSGDIPAKLIGYVCAPLLIPFIGLENLIFLAIFSLVIGFVLVARLILKKRWEKIRNKVHSVKHHHTDHGHEMSTLGFFFKHKLIFTVSILSILSYNVFNLIDYTFITQVKSKFHDLAALASFVSIFFASGRLIALVLKLVFTSRLIEKLGIIACLLITPVTLFVFCMLFLTISHDATFDLFVFGAMALLTEVLRSTMQEPTFFILFQPLNEHTRLKGHIIAKGYMMAPSLLVVGASLLILRYLGVETGIIFSVKVLLLNLVVWGGIVFYIRREYASALHNSIARGIFNAEHIRINDKKTIDILLEKIDAGTESEKIYALKLLESSGYGKLGEVLQLQLYQANPEVKRYALQRLEELGGLETGLLKDLLQQETDPDVRQMIITQLCKIDPDYLKALSDKIPELDYAVRKSVIIHLLNQSEFTYLHKAGNEINSLLKSALPEERELAVEIISELKTIKFTDAIEALIKDGDVSVKRNAFIAACKLRIKALLPFILERLAIYPDKYLAMQGLFQYGDTLFDDIHQATVADLSLYYPELIKIAAKAKGPASTGFLLSLLDHHTGLEEQVIHALWQKGFEAEAVPHIHKFHSLLGNYLKLGFEKIDYHTRVPRFTNHELIRDALGSEIRNDLVSSLKICAMLYHKKELNRIIELVESNDIHKLYNGMEMLEMVLPKRTAHQVNELLDYLLDPSSLRRHSAAHDLKSFLEKIVVTHAREFNPWTKGVCLFSCFKNNELDLIRNLIPAPDPNENVLLKETREFVLKGTQESVYAAY